MLKICYNMLHEYEDLQTCLIEKWDPNEEAFRRAVRSIMLIRR